MLGKKKVKSVRANYKNAVKKSSTEGHTTIKTLLNEEIKKIPEWKISNRGKRLTRNVSAYVKKRHLYIFNTNYLEKGEEESARKTIIEYLYCYILKKDEAGPKDMTNGTSITLEEHEMCTMVPTVGGRKICIVENEDLFIKIDDASIDLMEEYVNKVPLSFATPGIVDGKEYIIAVVDLPVGTPVHNLPVKYKNFPVLIDYGAMKYSAGHSVCDYHEVLKPEISIGDPKLNSSFPLGPFFTTENQPDKKYLLTVVGEVGNSIIQPSEEDNGNISGHHCAKVTIYKDLSVDTKGNLIDFAFCEIDESCVVTNKTCVSNISIKDIKCILDYKAESIISVQKVGRMTGLTVGQMRNLMKNIEVTDTNKEKKYGKMLIVNGFFGKHGDSGSPVYDQDGLWGIYQCTGTKSGYSSGIVPIDLILEKIYENEGVEFFLLTDEE